MTKPSVMGSLPLIIRNDDQLYEGNLVQYFQDVFYNAENLQHPYHNFRHIFHVLFLCYQACDYYEGTLTPRDMRSLLIAAMFHDFDHTGRMGPDSININWALQGLEKYLLPEDRPYFEVIGQIIKWTEYPPTVKSQDITLSGQIIRDADMSQVYSVAWLQQVIFGLAEEWKLKPIEVLRKQIPFLSGLTFHTEWAQQQFKDHDREAKMAEVNALLDLLELKPSTVA